jgi:hypothetical protein
MEGRSEGRREGGRLWECMVGGVRVATPRRVEESGFFVPVLCFKEEASSREVARVEMIADRPNVQSGQ